mmetsp:Transcript_13850/g.55870  ORF Transcript_13850/g.55870 Transcript_13850/m.55870 type:complete len:219 (+) Transcript_13850:3203-3859(+)
MVPTNTFFGSLIVFLISSSTVGTPGATKISSYNSVGRSLSARSKSNPFMKTLSDSSRWLSSIVRNDSKQPASAASFVQFSSTTLSVAWTILRRPVPGSPTTSKLFPAPSSIKIAFNSNSLPTTTTSFVSARHRTPTFAMSPQTFTKIITRLQISPCPCSTLTTRRHQQKNTTRIKPIHSTQARSIPTQLFPQPIRHTRKENKRALSPPFCHTPPKLTN